MRIPIVLHLRLRLGGFFVARIVKFLFCWGVLCLTTNVGWSAEITGRAVDLRGNTIPTIRNLTVVAESLQGATLNRLPATIDADAGTYRITIDDALLRASGSVFVSLTLSAPGRLTATLTNISGLRNQTIDAVLPAPEDMGYYPPSMIEPICCPPVVPFCCPPAMPCCGHQRWLRW
jgi:hypothetical protein